MIEKVKDFILSNINKPLNFKYNGTRNQVIEFSGVIVSLYPYIFIVKENNNFLRSFSYTDVLIGNLEIK